MELEIYEALVRRSLEYGVPSNVVAAVFDLPPDVVKEMRREVQVAEYGTADQAEYLDHLQWLTLKRAGEMIEHGSPAEAAKVATAVLGRQIAAAGKKPSDATTAAVAELMGRFSSIREGVGAPAAKGRFVVGTPAADRPGEDDDDD